MYKAYSQAVVGEDRVVEDTIAGRWIAPDGPHHHPRIEPAKGHYVAFDRIGSTGEDLRARIEIAQRRGTVPPGADDVTQDLVTRRAQPHAVAAVTGDKVCGPGGSTPNGLRETPSPNTRMPPEPYGSELTAETYYPFVHATSSICLLFDQYLTQISDLCCYTKSGCIIRHYAEEDKAKAAPEHC